MVQASSFRKRSWEEDGEEVGMEVVGLAKREAPNFLGDGWEAVERREACWDSSQEVVQVPEMKSGWATMAFRMGMLVWIPVMCVSSKARRALARTAGQVEAVMMSLAIRLSKSAVTADGMPFTMFVSQRMPLPEGKCEL